MEQLFVSALLKQGTGKLHTIGFSSLMKHCCCPFASFDHTLNLPTNPSLRVRVVGFLDIHGRLLIAQPVTIT
jgi:hypothetical protein